MTALLVSLLLAQAASSGQATTTAVSGKRALDVYIRSPGGSAGDGSILDGDAAGEADVVGSAPAGTEQGLVVRNIPSGTQPVSLASLPALGAGSANIGDVDVLTLPATATHASTTSATRTALGARVEVDGAAMDSTGVADQEEVALKADAEGRLFVRTEHPNRFHASLFASTATTLTQIQAAPGAGLSLYITDVTMSSSAASTATADQQLLLKRGTGTNCGTGTGTVWAVFAPANGGATTNLSTPIKLPANEALCFIGAAAGTKHVSVHGFTAP